jgi:cyclophilin family peptidyl-prolyl cis-trans isomerase
MKESFMKFGKFRGLALLAFVLVPFLSATMGFAKTLSWDKPPEMKIDKEKSYTAIVETSKGKITIELFAKDAPLAVNNFVFLAQQGFYKNVVFHRIIQSFMIQTGDPKGTGEGGPGYNFADELGSTHKYGPGIVAMANAGPNTNGSQFFICTGLNAASLNSRPNYTVFGNVISGMDVVQTIAKTPVGPSPSGEDSAPKEKVLIKNVTIQVK